MTLRTKLTDHFGKRVSVEHGKGHVTGTLAPCDDDLYIISIKGEEKRTGAVLQFFDSDILEVDAERTPVRVTLKCKFPGRTEK